MVNSCEKGKRAERALAKFLRELGYVFARRGQQHDGLEGEDVVGVPGHHIECKWDEALNVDKAMAQAIRDGAEGKIPIVIHRKTLERSAERKARFYRPWKVTMRAEDYFDMVERLEQLKDKETQVVQVVRATKRLEPCNDPDCKFAKSGLCCFGLRDMGCFMENDIVQDAVALFTDKLQEART